MGGRSGVARYCHLVPMSAPIDPSRASVSMMGDGSVQFSDPAGPWVVRLWVDPSETGQARIGALRIDVADPAHPVTAGRLAALPVRHLLHVAVAHLAASHAPNEVFYRMLAIRPRGQRGWGDDHYRRVRQVADWARETGRPGGVAHAVADMWTVSVRTAYRWLAEAGWRPEG